MRSAGSLWVAVLAAGLSIAIAVPAGAQAPPPTWDADPAVEARADALLAQMTNAEKADLATGELNNNYGFYDNPIARLGIPALTMADGPVGVRIANPAVDRRSTQFPSATAMSATFDLDLVRAVGAAIGDEAFHTGHNVQLAPAVDIARTPLWGRAFEGYGEDPLLNGLMGTQFIDGLQSNPGVMATIKHFVAYDQETNRFTVDALVDDRTLHEVYNKPFETAVQAAHPGAAMCAFNKVNGTFACENPLLNTMLKAQDGLRGFVMSDYNATPSTVAAADNGLDQEQPGDQGPGSANFGDRLVVAVAAGQVSQGRLDDMARRILRPMVGLGLFDHPVQSDRFDEAAHAQLARRVADEGAVLLRNRRHALPLRPGRRLRTLAVIGPDADNTSAQGGGSSEISHPTGAVSPLDGIRARAGSGVTVTYAPGTDGINEGDMLPGAPPVPSTVLRPAGGGAADRGLHAEYWSNTTFAGAPALTETDPNVNVNFGFQNFPGFNAASPKATQSVAVSGNFAFLGDLSARWTGDLIAPDTATYTLGLTARGDATLYVDGTPFITHSGALSSQTKSIDLVAGAPHAIRIDYSAPAASTYQGAEVRFSWAHADSVMAPAMRDAVAQARDADAAVVVVRDYETEGYDRPSLDLPKEQDQLIRQVAQANPDTTVVVETGAPSKTSTWDDRVAAILHAWYPGQEQGNAIADILFGDVNPSGHLVATVARDESQVPAIAQGDTAPHDEGVFVGYRNLQQRGLRPSYPFGFGLSYSTFRYTRLRVDDGRRNEPQGDVTVSFRLRNRSRIPGAEVAQAYVGRLPASVDTPPRQLAGFARVTLAPRERRDVTITIPRRSLSYWDSGAQRWVTPAGRVPVYVGGSSEDTALAGVIDVRPGA
ncbi:MAG: Beta-glucosidase [Conexibacter sp.]|nr:Beta-glucosidase [Conexibacter sp.]